MNPNSSYPTDNHKRADLYQTLSREKEALVTMFLSSASQMELTEQIRKIDELCLKIDGRNTLQQPQ